MFLLLALGQSTHFPCCFPSLLRSATQRSVPRTCSFYPLSVTARFLLSDGGKPALKGRCNLQESPQLAALDQSFSNDI